MARWVLQQRYCKDCGTPVGKNKHRCPDCKAERERLRNQGRKRSGPHKMVERECEYCSRSFIAAASDLKRGQGRYCSLSCAGKHQRIVHPRSPKPGQPPSCKLRWVECPVCGEQFIKRGPRKYCSDACAYQALLERLRDKRAWEENAKERPLCECAECGKVFRPEYGNKRRRYCSVECQGRHKHRVAHDQERASGDRWRCKAGPSIAAIGIRDGWRCHLCGKKVDPKLKAPHPMSASRDHLVPHSQDGTWERSNIRLAHYGCNARRGAGGEVQLLLFG